MITGTQNDLYVEWNRVLGEYFFNENMAGREVLLYANFDLIEKLGSELGGKEGFIDALKTGPKGFRDNDICIIAYKILQTWRFDRSADYPPYIAYLVLFVLAAYVDGDFDPNAYYPKLRFLLNINDDSYSFPYRHKMYELWDDLEKWSKEDREEELGSFTARIRGQRIHVGLPLSQTILSQEERDNLVKIFVLANLEPGITLPDSEIQKVLTSYGGEYLNRRTSRLLNGREDKELAHALIEFVKEELIVWNGSAPIEDIEQLDKVFIRCAVKICLQIVPLSKQVKGSLRLKSNYDFPIEGLNLISENTVVTTSTLNCKRSTQFWTTPLKNDDQKIFDAFGFDWNKTVSLVDSDIYWRGITKSDGIKLFIRGKQEQLPDTWVESSNTLERNSEFAVACLPSFSSPVQNWIEKACQKIASPILLPNGWSFYQAKNATSSFEMSPYLTLSTQTVLRMRNGIRLGRQNTFLNYYLPKVVIENGEGDVQVELLSNDKKIAELIKENNNSWTFPMNLPVDKQLRLRVISGSEEIEFKGRKIVTLHDGSAINPNKSPNPPSRATNGNFIKLPTSDFGISGAKVMGLTPNVTDSYNLHLFPSNERIVFLGQRPGEIADYEQDLFLSWKPIWALVKIDRKKWRVIFCANSLKFRPVSALKSASLILIKEWKRFIWVNRKVNDLSQLQLMGEKKLWEEYKNAARKL